MPLTAAPAGLPPRVDRAAAADRDTAGLVRDTRREAELCPTCRRDASTWRFSCRRARTHTGPQHCCWSARVALARQQKVQNGVPPAVGCGGGRSDPSARTSASAVMAARCRSCARPTARAVACHQAGRQAPSAGAHAVERGVLVGGVGRFLSGKIVVSSRAPSERRRRAPRRFTWLTAGGAAKRTSRTAASSCTWRRCSACRAARRRSSACAATPPAAGDVGVHAAIGRRD
jgi:hypothetical protein